MPRYTLRTLLIVLALGPPALAGLWFLFGQTDIGILLLVVAVLAMLVSTCLAGVIFAIAGVLWLVTVIAERVLRVLER